MSATHRPVPTGAERILAPDELVFSTTDRRGIIRTANSVFSRISGYRPDDLVGSPHSIVRHPDMPAGAFRLMWDRLSSGHPMAAYVENLAGDGATYWVFATVIPRGDGYLSVRVSPRSVRFEPVRQVYAEVRRREVALAGLDARAGPAVALAGAQELGRLLAGMGFPSYDDFMIDALSDEVAARDRRASPGYARPHAVGPTAEVLAGARALDLQLVALVTLVDGYRDLCRRLTAAVAAVQGITSALTSSVDAAVAAAAHLAGDAPALANIAKAMATPTAAVTTAFADLVPRLADLRADVAALRLRFALARLHAEMLAAWVCEVIDGAAPVGGPVVTSLCDAVQDGVVDMSATGASVGAGLAAAARQVTAAGELLDDLRRFLGQWRILVLRHDLGASLRDHLDPIDQQIGAAHDQVENLRDLARRCRSAAGPLGTAALEGEIARIRAAAPE